MTAQNYGYNYEKAFTAAHVPYCTSDEPAPLDSNMDDIQLRGEYVTYAIRRVHQLARRPIAVLGHSQGGMVMRWALRWWPDTRPMVADVIGMAGSNHGTDVSATCAVQDICPLDTSDHLALGTSDSVAYALVTDALTHDGPAAAARISPTVCTQPLMPGIDPVTYPTDSAASTVALEEAFTTYPALTAEPPLACYVTASCPRGGA